jgi:hypothetical protein
MKFIGTVLSKIENGRALWQPCIKLIAHENTCMHLASKSVKGNGNRALIMKESADLDRDKHK